MFIFARTEVKEKATELDVLKDTMANEQKKSRELQWALEKEKAKMERNEERGREELEVCEINLNSRRHTDSILILYLTLFMYCAVCAPDCALCCFRTFP